MAIDDKVIKLQIMPGKANPSPPVGPALGQHGVNIKGFCDEFNAKTKDMDPSLLCPVVITVKKDRSFTFAIKCPPMSALIKKKLSLTKGSAIPNKDKVGKLTLEQIREIAEAKMPDLNAHDIDAAMSIVKGSAMSMGVEVAEEV
jgi:large subunit ribosomal protein L11|tara:strand:- start:843 stop:1274 length:432 start_codon:yes stop_codon:yes gene_type:complete